MNPPAEEPAIPRRLRRPFAAVWISLGVHAALIALVQVAPPAASHGRETVIEARLVERHAAAVVDTPFPDPAARTEERVQLPSEAAAPLPVATPPPPAAAPEAASAVAPAGGQPEPPASEAPASVSAAAPVAAITSAVDLTYYSVRDLDVQPRALREIVPEYPYDADRQHLSGKVSVQLKLEADGRVGDLEIVSATPPGVFEASALEALRTARFAPAQKNGRPVRAQVVITIEYDWEGRRRR
jgi:protein TonB